MWIRDDMGDYLQLSTVSYLRVVRETESSPWYVEALLPGEPEGERVCYVESEEEGHSLITDIIFSQAAGNVTCYCYQDGLTIIRERSDEPCG